MAPDPILASPHRRCKSTLHQIRRPNRCSRRASKSDSHDIAKVYRVLYYFWQKGQSRMVNVAPEGPGAEVRCPRSTIAIHARAHPSLAQDLLDSLAPDLGPPLLALPRPAKLPLFLRYRQRADRSRPLARERADLLLGRLRSPTLPDSLLHRSRRRAPDQPSHHRRDRIHVRSPFPPGRPAAELVPHHHAASAPLGDRTCRLRFSRMEAANCAGLDRRPHKLFLASGNRCELGPRPVLPRATLGSRVALSAGLFTCSASAHLFSNPSSVANFPATPEAVGSPIHRKHTSVILSEARAELARSVLPAYSYLSATVGSTRVARRAGM